LLIQKYDFSSINVSMIESPRFHTTDIPAQSTEFFKIPRTRVFMKS